jgi:orotate phosphoribosyltransferase
MADISTNQITQARKQALASEIVKKARLSGVFKLRSGQTSNVYFDKYKFESDPKLLLQIAEMMAPLIPQGTEVLAALEMGGIPIGTALSLKTGLPITFVRKKAKDYGTEKIAEGAEIHGKKVCIIEDVITTGGQVFLSLKDLQSLGAQVEYVLCVIDRGENSAAKMKEAGLELRSLLLKADLD